LQVYGHAKHFVENSAKALGLFSLAEIEKVETGWREEQEHIRWEIAEGRKMLE